MCEQSLCQYVVSLANGGLAHASIKCYLSAVRHLHIEEGWGDPRIKQMAIRTSAKGCESGTRKTK